MEQIATLVFSLRGREKYLSRYLDLARKFGRRRLIFVLREADAGIPENDGENPLKIVETGMKIQGMADIFHALGNFLAGEREFEFCHFVEDDNFAFPSGLSQAAEILTKEAKVDGVCGRAFLHSPSGELLNAYRLPRLAGFSARERLDEYDSQGGLSYYSLFRASALEEICRDLASIDDDNLTEVAFNYLCAMKARVLKTGSVFLAREYPRPPVYNIPVAEDWIAADGFPASFRRTLDALRKAAVLHQTGLETGRVFESTLKRYLALRLAVSPKRRPFPQRVVYKLNKMALAKHPEVREYLRRIGDWSVKEAR